MIAYSTTGLDNLRMGEEATSAVDKGCISKEEEAAIRKAYPVPFYTPHFAIRVGLFLLTVVAAVFSLGLFFFIFMSRLDALSYQLFFFTLLSYAALEMFVRQKQHYQSGVDDALLWLTVIFFVSGLSAVNNLPLWAGALMVFVLSAFLAYRFADGVMTAVGCLSLMVALFSAWTEVGSLAQSTMPFVVMAAAAVLYFWSQRVTKKSKAYYNHCITVIKVVALLCFYAGGNYFMVREMGNELFVLNLKEGEGITAGPLFWGLTVAIPLLYLYRGVQVKDAVFLRVGLLLLAVMVFTIRYYHHLMPLEIAMVIGGSMMIMVAYLLIRYLKQPRHGFSYEEEADRSLIPKLQVEALVINQTFSTPGAPDEEGTRFGGGSGGGAGASGSY